MAESETQSQAASEDAVPQPQIVLIEPLKVVYCGVCGVPPEYCEFGKTFTQCLEWMKNNAPELHEQVLQSQLNKPAAASAAAAPAQQQQDQIEEQKADQPAKVAAVQDDSKKKEPKKVRIQEQPKITLTMKQRQKKKFNTFVKGLGLFNISLKDASKKFRQKFATGSSIVDDEDDTVEIQGEVVDGVIELLCKEYPQLTSQNFKIIDSTPQKK